MASSTPHRKRRTRKPRLRTAAALAVAALAVPLHADSRYYVGPDDGAWNSPLNWSATQNGPGGAGVPAPGDTAFVLSPTTNVTFDADYTSPLSNLLIDAATTTANTPTLTQSAHALSATNEYVGEFNSGAYAQTGGSNTPSSLFLGVTASAHGAYSLSGSGSLTVTGTDEMLGLYGTASFSQTGGTHLAYGDMELALYAGSSANYSLSGNASLTTDGDQYVGYGGTATFDQTGGTNNLTYLHLGRLAGASGTYSLSGTGVLNVGADIVVGYEGTGTFVQTGGTVDGTGFWYSSLDLGYEPDTSGGAYLLSGTGTLALSGDEHVGDESPGSFTQTGGSNTLDGSLYVDFYSTYSLSGDASLRVGQNEVVGATYDATFVQSGGTHTVAGYLDIGTIGSVTGTYSLSGAGSLAVAGDEYVGDYGAGTFTQTAGTNAVAGTLYVGTGGPTGVYSSDGSRTVYADGSYSLSGTASLTVSGDERVGDAGGSGTFTQSGGTHSVAGTLSLATGFAYTPDTGTVPSTGSYTLSAGSLTAAATTLESNATFLYTGGSASLGALTLNGTARLLLSPGHDKSLRATSLSLAPTAQLDLADNTLILSSTPADTLRSYLLAHSLFSSSADPTHTLGYLTTPSSTLVQLTLTGDANMDGVVNADDYALLDRAYARSLTSAHWTDGDFNYDGTITPDDYLLIDTTFAASHPLTPAFLSQRESQFGPAYVSTLLASVPEPASLAACCLAFLSLTRRRRE